MKMYGKKTVALFLVLAMMLSCSVSVFAFGEAEWHGIDDYEIEYTGRYTDVFYLEDILAAELADRWNADIDDWEFWTESVTGTPDNNDFVLDYGSISYSRSTGSYAYEIDLDITDTAADDLYEYGKLYEERIYYWAEEGNYYEYEGYIDLVIVGEAESDLTYEMDGETELYLGEQLARDLDALLTSNLDYVVFELDNYNDCGELYYWDDYYEEWLDFDEDADYVYLPEYNDDYDLEGIFFEPDGTEGEFIIYYTAYGLRNNEKVEGTITIVCGEGLLLEVDISGDEYYTFDSYDFQDAVDNWNDAYTLVYLDNIKLADSSKGDLYYDYDEDDSRHTAIGPKEEYYVDSRANDVLDYVTFVPERNTKGTVVINFDALVEKTNGRGEETLAGVLKINVDKASDITVKAGIGDTVSIDWEVFQEYLEEDTNSRQYEVAYVTISNAPRSSEDGYLLADGEKLSRGDKTFYLDPGKNQYDLETLSYQAGSKKGSHEATFTVYYYKTSSSRTATATHEGTIKFEVSATTSITTTTPLKAANVMSFAYELAAIQNMGGNNNVYIEFTALPINGKLVYDFGTTTQQDVTLNKAYYLAAASGQAQLSRVTYVPSYSSSKVIKYDTIGVKCYDKKDNSVKGTINIAVQYAQFSAQFTDVKDSKYADSVDYLYNQKITTGMTATTFGLTENVTRGQFVTFLYRAAGSPAVTGVTNKFTDVKAADYYYNAVLWAVKNGITSGRSDTIFDPTAPVNHQEMATFLYRYDVNYLGHPGTLGGSSYVTDFSSVDSWAQNPVKWASNKGIIDYGAMQPKNAATRATVALWLHRMLTL